MSGWEPATLCYDIVERYKSVTEAWILSAPFVHTKLENLTDLVKKTSISKSLNAGAFGTEMSSNQFGTDGRSLQLNETLLEENNVDKILGTSLLDGIKF